MKLVIDKSPEGMWRWSLVTVHGMNVKIHATGNVEGDSHEAFNAGWLMAIEKGCVKNDPPKVAP